jgi:Na+-transporting NADH:ubiquinone oxidoreductase subunit NqrA
MRIKIKKGLDIPIKGEPEKAISDGAEVKTVAAVATDVSGIRPGIRKCPSRHRELAKSSR